MWPDITTARAQWPGAPTDTILADLLDIARDQVIAYAPELPLGAEVPVNYSYAALVQARDIWNAFNASPSQDQFGQDTFAIPVYPMSWHVKNLLRPTQGKWLVG